MSQACEGERPDTAVLLAAAAREHRAPFTRTQLYSQGSLVLPVRRACARHCKGRSRFTCSVPRYVSTQVCTHIALVAGLLDGDGVPRLDKATALVVCVCVCVCTWTLRCAPTLLSWPASWMMISSPALTNLERRIVSASVLNRMLVAVPSCKAQPQLSCTQPGFNKLEVCTHHDLAALLDVHEGLQQQQ